MRQVTLINFIALLIASTTSFAIVAPFFGQAAAFNSLQEKIYQPADMAGENIAKTFIGGEPPASRTRWQEPKSTSAVISSSSGNDTATVLSTRSDSGGGKVVVPTWLSEIYHIADTFFAYI